MRRMAIALVLLTVGSLAVVAQYTQATRFQFTTPRVAHYPTTACQFVEPDVTTFACYREGVSECKRLNSGTCFRNCERDVRNVCFNTVPFPSCFVPRDFEKDFATRNQCAHSVNTFCARNCAGFDARDDCLSRGYAACSQIGRIFV